MNAENRKLVYSKIQEAGDEMTGYLRPHRFHLKKGRNPYAHMGLMIKCHFGESYKDLDDTQVPEVLNYISSMVKWEQRNGKRYMSADFRSKKVDWGLTDD